MSKPNFGNVASGSSSTARRSPKVARTGRPAPYPDVDSLPVSKRMQEHQRQSESIVKQVKPGLESLFKRKGGK